MALGGVEPQPSRSPCVVKTPKKQRPTAKIGSFGLRQAPPCHFLLPCGGRGVVHSLSKWADQDESHSSGRELLLIEVALPLEAINAESAREKSIRHGHPSTLHLWWARRPLAACRAVLFASLVDDPDSDPAYRGPNLEPSGGEAGRPVRPDRRTGQVGELEQPAVLIPHGPRSPGASPRGRSRPAASAKDFRARAGGDRPGTSTPAAPRPRPSTPCSPSTPRPSTLSITHNFFQTQSQCSKEFSRVQFLKDGVLSPSDLTSECPRILG